MYNNPNLSSLHIRGNPMNVTKRVIPAAGFRTWFLPVTKVQLKEMMSVLDKPIIQYVVEEAVDFGIDDLFINIGRDNKAIERRFEKSYELEEELAIDRKTENESLDTLIQRYAAEQAI